MMWNFNLRLQFGFIEKRQKHTKMCTNVPGVTNFYKILMKDMSCSTTL